MTEEVRVRAWIQQCPAAIPYTSVIPLFSISVSVIPSGASSFACDDEAEARNLLSLGGQQIPHS